MHFCTALEQDVRTIAESKQPDVFKNKAIEDVMHHWLGTTREGGKSGFADPSVKF
jgi:hypothetical protein